jgi:TonB family protein
MMRGVSRLLLAAFLWGGAPLFEAPRLVSGEAPVPGPLSIGWASELLVARVDAAGRVRDVATRNSDSLLASVVTAWTFEPAREGTAPVPADVLVAAILRPATYPDLTNPPDLAGQATWLPNSVPRPTASSAPPYPVGRVGSGAVIVEIRVNAQGTVERTGIVGPQSGFDSAALTAAASWRFKAAMRDGTPVPASVYAVFGFREPVVLRK